MHQPTTFFLRGINVNGRRIVMDDLRACLSDAGYTDVRTILATGNVVCVPPVQVPTDTLKAHIEALLTARFGYAATIHLRTVAQLQALSQAAAQLTVPAASHCYALLCSEPATVTALAAAYHALAPDPTQQFVALAADALWVVPKGQTLDAPFGKTVLGNKRYTVLVTSRTIETIQKTLQIAAAGND